MFSPSSIGNFVNYFIIYVVGFILGSFGGMYSECSGIINIALEGSMVVGAFSGIMFLQIMADAAANTWLTTTLGGVAILYILGSLVAILISILFSFPQSLLLKKHKKRQAIFLCAFYIAIVCLL